MELFDLTNDEFIRTTDPDHIRQVQLFVKKLMDRGDIYLGEFEGWYDRGQEEYITENRARELDYKVPSVANARTGKTVELLLSARRVPRSTGKVICRSTKLCSTRSPAR